jgi:hypothetical protein
MAYLVIVTQLALLSMSVALTVTQGALQSCHGKTKTWRQCEAFARQEGRPA